MVKLLNAGNYKTRKGEKMGYKTYGIHLAPHKLSGYNVCPKASKGCSAACLNTAGRGAMSSVQRARIAKTIQFFKDRPGFMSSLIKEVTAAVKQANKQGKIPCFRLNLTSDLSWESIRYNGQTILEMFPNVTFYDYTADASRMTRFLSSDMPSNYHLTFSRKESTPNELVKGFLNSGGNVAIVFRKSLPTTYFGANVIDGDDTDLRFLDGKGVVVGLKEKGKAKKDDSGFVVEPVNC
jgi:hypothetical protein